MSKQKTLLRQESGSLDRNAAAAAGGANYVKVLGQTKYKLTLALACLFGIAFYQIYVNEITNQAYLKKINESTLKTYDETILKRTTRQLNNESFEYLESSVKVKNATGDFIELNTAQLIEKPEYDLRYDPKNLCAYNPCGQLASAFGGSSECCDGYICEEVSVHWSHCVPPNSYMATDGIGVEDIPDINSAVVGQTETCQRDYTVCKDGHRLITAIKNADACCGDTNCYLVNEGTDTAVCAPSAKDALDSVSGYNSVPDSPLHNYPSMDRNICVRENNGCESNTECCSSKVTGYAYELQCIRTIPDEINSKMVCGRSRNSVRASYANSGSNYSPFSKPPKKQYAVCWHEKEYNGRPRDECEDGTVCLQALYDSQYGNNVFVCAVDAQDINNAIPTIDLGSTITEPLITNRLGCKSLNDVCGLESKFDQCCQSQGDSGLACYQFQEKNELTGVTEDMSICQTNIANVKNLQNFYNLPELNSVPTYPTSYSADPTPNPPNYNSNDNRCYVQVENGYQNGDPTCRQHPCEDDSSAQLIFQSEHACETNREGCHVLILGQDVCSHTTVITACTADRKQQNLAFDTMDGCCQHHGKKCGTQTSCWFIKIDSNPSSPGYSNNLMQEVCTITNEIEYCKDMDVNNPTKEFNRFQSEAICLENVNNSSGPVSPANPADILCWYAEYSDQSTCKSSTSQQVCNNLKSVLYESFQECCDNHYAKAKYCERSPDLPPVQEFCYYAAWGHNGYYATNECRNTTDLAICGRGYDTYETYESCCDTSHDGQCNDRIPIRRDCWVASNWSTPRGCTWITDNPDICATNYTAYGEETKCCNYGFEGENPPCQITSDGVRIMPHEHHCFEPKFDSMLGGGTCEVSNDKDVCTDPNRTIINSSHHCHRYIGLVAAKDPKARCLLSNADKDPLCNGGKTENADFSPAPIPQPPQRVGPCYERSTSNGEAVCKITNKCALVNARDSNVHDTASECRDTLPPTTDCHDVNDNCKSTVREVSQCGTSKSPQLFNNYGACLTKLDMIFPPVCYEYLNNGGICTKKNDRTYCNSPNLNSAIYFDVNDCVDYRKQEMIRQIQLEQIRMIQELQASLDGVAISSNDLDIIYEQQQDPYNEMGYWQPVYLEDGRTDCAHYIPITSMNQQLMPYSTLNIRSYKTRFECCESGHFGIGCQAGQQSRSENKCWILKSFGSNKQCHHSSSTLCNKNSGTFNIGSMQGYSTKEICCQENAGGASCVNSPNHQTVDPHHCYERLLSVCQHKTGKGLCDSNPSYYTSVTSCLSGA